MNSRPAPRRRTTAVVLAAVAFIVVATVLVAAATHRGPGPDRTVVFPAALVRTVDLQGAPGQVVIAGAVTSRVTLTGQLHWTGHAPLITTRLDRAAHVLRLTYRCAAASPCTGNYRLVVPRRTTVNLRQPAGHVIVSGLAGALRIVARSVDVSATGLRVPALAATITSGHLSATFDLPPRRISLALTSAQATLRLPAGIPYAVRSQVTSGYVHVGIPQDSTAPRTVTDRIISGELELQSR